MKSIKLYMYKDGDHLIFRPHQDVLYYTYVDKLDQDRTVEITLKPNKPSKTNSQLGYWYGVLMPFAQNSLVALGHDTLFDTNVCGFTTGVETTRETTDLLFKTLYKAHKNLNYLPLKRKMTTEDMSSLIDFTLKWLATNLGVYAPTPKED